MKANHAWFTKSDPPRMEIRVCMLPEEWQAIVNLVWNYAPDLNDTVVANFLHTLEKVNIKP